MCRTGKREGLCKTSSHLSLQSPVIFCFLALFSVPVISSQVMKTNIVSLNHIERKYYLLHIISMCLPRALQQWSEYGIIQKNALCSSCFPHCELSQNPLCHWTFILDMALRIVSSRAFTLKKKILYALKDFIAQAVRLWITSEQKEFQTIVICMRNNSSVAAERKKTLLFLTIIPYLPNNWRLNIFIQRLTVHT